MTVCPQDGTRCEMGTLRAPRGRIRRPSGLELMVDGLDQTRRPSDTVAPFGNACIRASEERV